MQPDVFWKKELIFEKDNIKIELDEFKLKYYEGEELKSESKKNYYSDVKVIYDEKKEKYYVLDTEGSCIDIYSKEFKFKESHGKKQYWEDFLHINYSNVFENIRVEKNDFILFYPKDFIMKNGFVFILDNRNYRIVKLDMDNMIEIGSFFLKKEMNENILKEFCEKDLKNNEHVLYWVDCENYNIFPYTKNTDYKEEQRLIKENFIKDCSANKKNILELYQSYKEKIKPLLFIEHLNDLKKDKFINIEKKIKLNFYPFWCTYNEIDSEILIIPDRKSEEGTFYFFDIKTMNLKRLKNPNFNYGRMSCLNGIYYYINLDNNKVFSINKHKEIVELEIKEYLEDGKVNHVYRYENKIIFNTDKNLIEFDPENNKYKKIKENDLNDTRTKVLSLKLQEDNYFKIFRPNKKEYYYLNNIKVKENELKDNICIGIPEKINDDYILYYSDFFNKSYLFDIKSEKTVKEQIVPYNTIGFFNAGSDNLISIKKYSKNMYFWNFKM